MDSNTQINVTERQKFGILSGIIGICTNIVLAVFKLIIGLLTASVAIMADAMNNLSDAGSSIISFVSFKLSAKPADRDHPFGHARIEYVASMVVSFLILLVGFEMLTDSLSVVFGFSETETPEFSTISLVILGVSVFVKLALSIFYRKIGKKIDSSVVLASSTDSFFDSISTFAVLVSSIIIKYTDLAIIDAIVGLAVSLLIIWAGIRTLNETKNSILGEAPVKETVEEIMKIVKEYPEIIGTHDLLVHNYGPGHYISSFHAEVNGADDIYLLHDVIDNVEKRIAAELGIICTIHLDPITTDDEFVNELKELTANVVKGIRDDIGMHDFRVVHGVTHTNLIFDLEVPFEANLTNEYLTKTIESEIQKARTECFCVITVDRC